MKAAGTHHLNGRITATYALDKGRLYLTRININGERCCGKNSAFGSNVRSMYVAIIGIVLLWLILHLPYEHQFPYPEAIFWRSYPWAG
jgi:hypothetical protein